MTGTVECSERSRTIIDYCSGPLVHLDVKGEAIELDVCAEHLGEVIRSYTDLGCFVTVAAVAACDNCATPLARTMIGRPRQYCSDACRQSAGRARRKSQG